MKIVDEEAAVRGEGGGEDGHLEDEGHDDDEEKNDCCYLESGHINHNTESFDPLGKVHILGRGNK